MTRLFLYDDAVARGFEPLALTRPVGELRAGAELIRRRWEVRLQLTAAGFVGAPHLVDFEEEGTPRSVAGAEELPAGSIIANTRCVVSLGDPQRDTGARAWLCGGRVAAVRIGASIRAEEFADGSLPLEQVAASEVSARGSGSEQTIPMTPATGAGTAEIRGRWLEEPWDLIGTLVEQLAEDIPALAATLTIHNPSDVLVIGEHPVFCERGAVLEPWVVLDATAGPILVRTEARVSAFSRLSGPCYVGQHATIVGDRVTACSIGDVAKVCGEISNSIVLAFSNKAHSGFVGHSYLGRWVNLGAGTTTSNLKNTYGRVQVMTSDGRRETGQQFLGTFFGDHVKTGIGTMLTTGTIIGAGANVFGTERPPKRVPPFAWGEREPYSRYELEKFLAVTERVMARRDVALTEGARRCLRQVYAAAG